MTPTTPPSILVFDVNETLLDLTTLEPLFERVFGRGEVMREWFAQLILYSEAMTLSGLYTPFGQLGGGVLEMVAETSGVSLHDDDIAELKHRMQTMPALPDVIPGLERLRDAGFRLVTLTNSAPPPDPTAVSPLKNAGIDGFFEQMLTVHVVRRFKPAAEVYDRAAEKLGVDAGELCLVACHLWDTLGAQAAGYKGAFIKRPGNAMLPVDEMLVPDIIASDMHDLADQIINQWAIDSHFKFNDKNYQAKTHT